MANMITPPQTFLLDRLWSIQNTELFISDDQIDKLSVELGISKNTLEGIISFYHFFHRKHPGNNVIYLNTSIVSEFRGLDAVKKAFEEHCGTRFGTVDPTGTFGLYETSCIGLSDHEPAALLNFEPLLDLTPRKVERIVQQLREGATAKQVADAVPENIQYTPSPDRTILLRNHSPGKHLKTLGQFHPETVIARVANAKLVGMGGAFFPAHLKWTSCSVQRNSQKYIVCNADEGEPGTFKDRLLLQKYPALMLEGMIMAGYAVGATQGLIYLRAEYFWLADGIKQAIEKYRENGWLGQHACGIEGFHFDISLHMGAGAYVCGEETALLESLEGKRGEPRPKLYFPAERGFLGLPTVVSNVETFCAAARILELGGNYYGSLGTEDSHGTKLISISGDVEKPGIYEIEWGMSLQMLLDLSGAIDPYYVQMSGPSGYCIGQSSFHRQISLQDLPCGGSLMVFNSDRSILSILRNFADFFSMESCGICTPCRAGNFLIRRQLDVLLNGLADELDIKKIESWGQIMKMASRCGLGKTATNTITSALHEFPEFFGQYTGNGDPNFKKIDMDQIVSEYEAFNN